MYLCEKYYKLITVQYYIADCVSWVPRQANFVGLMNKLDSQTLSLNGTFSYVGDLLYSQLPNVEKTKWLLMDEWLNKS